MRWSDFEAAAPRLAEHGRERFEATRVALLGTVRRDGSARISPFEPHLAAGELLIGVMRSTKSIDIDRDKRITIHSSVSRPDGSEGEFKLFGLAVPVTDESVRAAPEKAWWQSYPVEAGAVYSVDITSATWVTWNWSTSTVDITTWTPEKGVATRTARYP